MKEIVLKYDDLKFIVPIQSEYGFLWPYYGICFAGEYDRLLNNIEKTDTVLDAGANIGIFTILASLKAVRVVAIEPDPVNYHYLVKNIELNGIRNVTHLCFALSDKSGNGYISGKGVFASLSSNIGIFVETQTIDTLIMNTGKFDVIKMDIEGQESNALKGVFINSVRELIVEVHGKENYDTVLTYLQSMRFLVDEWSFSSSNMFCKKIGKIGSFIDAELKTRFIITRLMLKYIIGLGAHPVTPIAKDSKIRLLYAKRYE